MAKVGAPRVPMGTSAIDETYYASANTGNQHLMPRGNVQAGDPTAGEMPAHRTNVQLGANRLGAKYTVVTNTVIPTAPEAGATQASGRIVPPKTIRSRESFDDGMGSSYN
jgi:hypothetical protein